MTDNDVRDKKGRFKPGKTIKHGAYRKRLPLRLKRLALTYKNELIKDLGGPERISTAKMMLIDKCMNLFQVTLAIEDYINTYGAFKGKKLEPILATNYVTYVNSIRLCLREIGLNPTRHEYTPDELRKLIAEEVEQ